MTIWRGIHSHTTDVDSTPGVSTYQANTRMRKELELQRRWGYLSSAIAQQTGPIKYIVAAHGLGNNFITLGGVGTVDGFGDGAGDPWPPPPDAPKKQRPEVIQQEPLCAVGGSGTGTLTVPDFASFGTCFVNGSISVTENCCYKVAHSISITGTKTYTGTVVTDYFIQYDINMSPTAGATCGAATAAIIAGNSFDNQPVNFNLNVEGYICNSTTASASPIWSLTHTNNTGGDVDRYTWVVSVTTTVTNVLCAACHP